MNQKVENMNNKLSVSVMVLLTAGMIGYFAWSGHKATQLVNSLPEGPGKAILTDSCGGCHSLDRVLKVPRSYQGWSAAILWMQKMHGMAPLPESDRDLLIGYLSQHFGIEP